MKSEVMRVKDIVIREGEGHGCRNCRAAVVSSNFDARCGIYNYIIEYDWWLREIKAGQRHCADLFIHSVEDGALIGARE